MAESGANARVGSARSSLDLATVIGLVCGFGVITTAIVLGGSPGSFINIPSILIVIGGTLAVTTACFSLVEIGRTARVMTKTLFRTTRDPSDAAIHVLQIAETARRQGVLSIQGNRGKRPGGQAAARWRMRSGRGRMGGAPGMSSRLPR